MSAIQDAFARAGYQDAEEWPCEEIKKIALGAMIAHAEDSEAAQRAIFDACCRRTSLLRALVLPWRREITAAVIANERRLLKARGDAENRTKQEVEAGRIVALEAKRAEAAAQEARQRHIEDRGRAAIERDAQLKEWLNNKARHEVIDGTPWWEVSPARLREFARRTTHRSKFYTLVLDRVPSHDDMRPVSYYLRSHEVDALWEEAWGNETPN